jgi:hypothetical protein
MNRTMLASVLLFITFATIGCGNMQPPMKNTITLQQAKERVTHYLQWARTAFPAEAKYTEHYTNEGYCDDPTDNGPRGRRTASQDYWIDGIDKTHNAQHFDNMLKQWKSDGWQVLTDNRPKDGYIWVENPADGFRMALQESAEGSLSIGATSPCVWPNGTPAPK